MILHTMSLMSHLPLFGKFSWVHVSHVRVDPPSVIVYEGLCKCLLCLMIVGKLSGPEVSLFEGLVERLDVPIFAFLDELVLADLDRPSKVVARVLVAIVRPYPQSRTVRLFCGYRVCDRLYGHVPSGTCVKRVRYSFARKVVHHVEASVDAAPDVRDIKFPQLVRGLGLEELAIYANNVVFRLLWLDITRFSVYVLDLLAVYGPARLTRH